MQIMKSFLEDRPEPWQGHALAECPVAALPDVTCRHPLALRLLHPATCPEDAMPVEMPGSQRVKARKVGPV